MSARACECVCVGVGICRNTSFLNVVHRLCVSVILLSVCFCFRHFHFLLSFVTIVYCVCAWFLLLPSRSFPHLNVSLYMICFLPSLLFVTLLHALVSSPVSFRSTLKCVSVCVFLNVFRSLGFFLIFNVV